MTGDPRGRLQPYRFNHASREVVLYSTSEEGAVALYDLWCRRPSVAGLTSNPPAPTLGPERQTGRHRVNGPPPAKEV